MIRHSTGSLRLELAAAFALLATLALGCGGQTLDTTIGGTPDGGSFFDSGGGSGGERDATLDADGTDPRERDSGGAEAGVAEAGIVDEPDAARDASSGAGCVPGDARCLPLDPNSGSPIQVISKCDAHGNWNPVACTAQTPNCQENSPQTGCVCLKDWCPGACVDLQTDPAHCGDCSTSCGSERVCQAGQCVCGVSHETLCGSATVDTNRDDANCGACGNVCGGTCQCGRCQVTLARGLKQVGQMAVDSTSVYWTDFSGGTVMKVPVGGGSATTLASGQDAPFGIAIDASNVYWVTEGFSTPGGSGGPSGSVKRVPLAGGTPVVLAASQPLPQGIAVDATNAYWTIFDESSGGVMQVALTGGTPVQIATSVTTLRAVAVDSAGVYWTDGLNVMRTAPGTDAGVMLATTPDAPSVFAIDANDLYWTSVGGSSSVMDLPLDGGAPLALGVGGAGLAADGTSVYFGYGIAGTNGTDNALARMPAGGGASSNIAWGPSFGVIVVDATSVYWADSNAGTIEKMTPK